VDPLIAVGGPGPRLSAGWDFWLPSYVLLSFLLLLVLFHARITARTCIAAFAFGNLWAWLQDATGVIPAAAAVVVVVSVAKEIVRRRRLQAPPG
jgi:hypothetical protein